MCLLLYKFICIHPPIICSPTDDTSWIITLMSIVQVIIVCSSPKAKTLSKPEPVQTGIKRCPQGILVWTGFTVYTIIRLSSAMPEVYLLTCDLCSKQILPLGPARQGCSIIDHSWRKKLFLILESIQGVVAVTMVASPLSYRLLNQAHEHYCERDCFLLFFFCVNKSTTDHCLSKLITM